MTLTTVVVAIGLIVFVLAKRVRGEAVPAPKKLFVLPIVVCLIGLQNLTHAKLNAVDIAVAGTGCAVSLGLGLLRGRLDKVSIDDRDAPYTKVRKLAKRHRTCSAQADNADVEVAKYSLTSVTKSEALS